MFTFDSQIDLQSHVADEIQDFFLFCGGQFFEVGARHGAAVGAIEPGVVLFRISVVGIHHELMVSEQAHDVVPLHNVLQHGDALRASVYDVAQDVKEIVVTEADVFEHFFEQAVLPVNVAASINVHT